MASLSDDDCHVDTYKPYSYKPLPSSDALRLLRLRPASDDSVDLDAELTVFDTKDFKDARRNTQYEAVSWCWGGEPSNEVLRILDVDIVYALRISQGLKAGLLALRQHDAVRQLWVDAICINQEDTKERNQQVPRMDQIYGRAKNVCVWLGEEDKTSGLAIDFINNRVLDLWDFDKLIDDRTMAKHWLALVTLMRRPWFSRRWVVQEIALSPSGGNNMVYCGKHSVLWQDFADAVSLFVEVESATHRLSDVMKKDELTKYIPDFFGDVSTLGAALLVDATSNLFRDSAGGDRQPLSTLEYLVSRLSVFESAQPRDTIYALLAISKDTTPRNEDPADPDASKAINELKKVLQRRNFANRSYNVDYKLPVLDVYKEFIEFAIKNSDQTRALDIICRPWAPLVRKSHDNVAFMKNPSQTVAAMRTEEDEPVALPSWISSLSNAAFEMEEHPQAGLRMERQNADPLVGMPVSDQSQTQRNYSAAGTKTVKLVRFFKWEACKPKDEHYPDFSMFVQGFVLNKVKTIEQIAANGNIPFQWLKPGGWKDTGKNPPDDFWRTIVADRGPGGRNPPTYFPRACRESMKFKAKVKAKYRGNLDSKQLINEGGCAIVAEFLRRVQAVIWNRLLMRTKDGRLGLVRDDVKPGFLICILYGCSVPVILEKVQKTETQMVADQEILFKDWLENREKFVLFFQRRWRKRQHEKVEKSRKNQTRKLKTPNGIASSQQTPLKRQTWAANTLHEKDKPHQNNIGFEAIPETPSLNGDSKNAVSKNAVIAQEYQPAVESRLEDSASDHQNVDNADGDDETDSSQKWNPAQLPILGKSRPDGPSELAKRPPKPNSKPRGLRQKRKTADAAEAERREGKAEAEQREARVREVFKTTHYYRLYGECYVHGMMNGEAIALQNANMGMQPSVMGQQEFEIR